VSRGENHNEFFDLGGGGNVVVVVVVVVCVRGDVDGVGGGWRT